MATLGGAKGGHMVRLGQKNLQKPESNNNMFKTDTVFHSKISTTNRYI